jgi:adhesin HecA-like repeat protein
LTATPETLDNTRGPLTATHETLDNTRGPLTATHETLNNNTRGPSAKTHEDLGKKSLIRPFGYPYSDFTNPDLTNLSSILNKHNFLYITLLMKQIGSIPFENM